MIRNEFNPYQPNENGMKKAESITLCFSEFLNRLEVVCGKDGRQMAIVKTKLEEAWLFANRAMASRPENQMGWIEPSDDSEKTEMPDGYR